MLELISFHICVCAGLVCSAFENRHWWEGGRCRAWRVIPQYDLRLLGFGWVLCYARFRVKKTQTPFSHLLSGKAPKGPLIPLALGETEKRAWHSRRAGGIECCV